MAPKLDVYERRARGLKGDGLSLESREGRDGDSITDSELGRHGCTVRFGSVTSSVMVCYVPYKHTIE